MVINFVPNGILLSCEETFVPKVLNGNRWLQIEERTIELLGCIQPNHKSEIHRNNVVSYIKDLITNHVPCQVFPFGSVPLKTYLPDGDIDLTVFGINQILPETFIPKILQKLESEINNESAKFRVKEVQFIQAEVKIIKCLIEDFVIDISFNQLSGLSALCFFEEVDSLIAHDHIFKQSIILVKAWCYHESRLLGSNSGLFSTYALKVLVLYIFNLYGNGFAGPLEVLFRFLEFYSKFDWNNYCISLRGPVPLSSLPDMTAEPPRKGRENQDYLLTEYFLGACMFLYGNMPRSQENQERQFVSKHINIIDPLRLDNNLGRSISKASFFRIRSALGLGAERMMRLLKCTEEYLIAEFDHFFKNTWNRHGNGYWIPVSIYNLYIRKVGKLPLQESEDEQAQASNMSRDNQMFRTSDACVVSQTQSSSRESAPIYSEAQNQHCNVFVSETESEQVHFSSSMSDNNMGSSSRTENASNIGLHKEEPDRSTITESSRTLYALTGRSVDKEEHGGVWNMTESRRSGYLEAVTGAKSKNNEAMRQQEEERHFLSTAENRKSLKYLDALLGVKKSHASLSPPPQQNMSYSIDKVQFPELKPPSPTVKRSINVGKDSVDPPAVVIEHDDVMNQAESCKYTPASNSISETNLSSLPPETTQPENIYGQSTVSTDIVRHESITSESVALNVHALQSPRAPGSSVLQFPSKSDNISHVEPSNYLSNQCFDTLYGDFVSYWVNLKYGKYCVNGHLEEPLYFPPTVEPPMDFQAQYYWDMSPSGSVSGVPLVVPDMPPTFASDSHIEDINQRVSFWIPGSSRGTGTFLPNPLPYHERHYDKELHEEHENANNISEISDGKKEALHQGEGEGSSSAVNELEGKKDAPDQGEGEGSSSAVNELENLEKDSKDDSPYQP
ncbi:PAP/OAS1 substrate-binding domain superfamily [Trifolium repens]|nr:PAP/OAS1 substrate-binding domain superfamily [Trifolium repens]